MRGDKECIDEDNEAYEERLREAVRRTVLLQILRTSGTSMARRRPGAAMKFSSPFAIMQRRINKVLSRAEARN